MTSRRPIGGWRRSFILISTPATNRPKSNSRRSRLPTISWAIRTSAPAMTAAKSMRRGRNGRNSASIGILPKADRHTQATRVSRISRPTTSCRSFSAARGVPTSACAAPTYTIASSSISSTQSTAESGRSRFRMAPYSRGQHSARRQRRAGSPSTREGQAWDGRRSSRGCPGRD